MNRIGLIFVLLAGFVSTAQAVNFQVSPEQTITGLRSYGTYAVVTYTPGVENTLDCGGVARTTSTNAGINFGNDTNLKVMYAAVLAAFVNGQTVGLGITNAPCLTFFGGGIPSVYRVDIE